MAQKESALSFNNHSSWGEDRSRRFTTLSDIVVPHRSLQIEIIRSLLPDKPELRIIDLCCGDGTFDSALLEGLENPSLLCLDGSAMMLESARERLSDFNNVEFREFRLESKAWRTLEKADAVIASLAIHHLTEAEKQELFSYVYSVLDEEGVFVIADIVMPDSAEGRQLQARLWNDSVREQSLELLGDESAYETFTSERHNLFLYPDPTGVDKPSSLFSQLKWLEEAGFREVDAHWHYAGHAIFSGKRKGSI